MTAHVNDISEEVKKQLNNLRSQIVNQLKDYQEVHANFEKRLNKVNDTYDPDTGSSHSDWSFHFHRNMTIRLRIIIEQNFKVLETLSLVSTTRYILECLIWLRTVNTNPSYVLVFIRDKLKDSKKEKKVLLDRTNTEIALFERLEKEETALRDIRIKTIAAQQDTITEEELRRLAAADSNKIDRAARHSFSIYREGAKINGYGLQAALLRKQAIPSINNMIEEVEKVISDFNNKYKQQLSELPKEWKWNQQATIAGLESQYNYIYSLTSRILHAQPGSILTDQKCLEPQEAIILLDFIYISLIECRRLLESTWMHPAVDRAN